MPTYCFESAKGSVIERVFTVAECPDHVVYRKKRYRKILAPVAIMRIPDAMTTSERKKALETKAAIEANEKAVRDGELVLTSSTHRERVFDPDFGRKIY